MTKECIGCQATCGKDPIEIYHIHKAIKCPCLICLVKAVCEDICIDFHDFETLRRKYVPKRTVIQTAYRKVPKKYYMSLQRLNKNAVIRVKNEVYNESKV